jgi:predicted metalloprotease
MRWQLGRRSDNVEDARGSRSIGLGGLSAGGVLLAVVASYFLGIDPMQMLGIMAQLQGDLPSDSRQARPLPADDEGADFVRAVLGDTEDTWTAIFESRGGVYEPPRLVLFSGMVRSGCGGASAASGPFYCPSDGKVYLDLSFFDEMRARLGGGGDFAQAYVISHEIGHHVQTLLGLTRDVDEARQQGDIRGDEGLLVRQEPRLMSCGVWANRAQARHQWLDAGDVEQAMSTATAIGDDRLQHQSQGAVVPDAFTHGTSKQRVRCIACDRDGEMGRREVRGVAPLASVTICSAEGPPRRTCVAALHDVERQHS